MSILKTIFEEKNMRRFFTATLGIKAVYSFFEVLGGIAAYFVSQNALLSMVQFLTADELSEDPRDLVANYFLHAAQSMSVSIQHFAAFYLLTHGVVKLWLIFGLLRKKIWYYPVALVVFALFVVYQMYRYTFTHSPLLIVLTIIDLVVIWLTWHEYRLLRKTQPVSSANTDQEE